MINMKVSKRRTGGKSHPITTDMSIIHITENMAPKISVPQTKLRKKRRRRNPLLHRDRANISVNRVIGPKIAVIMMWSGGWTLSTQLKPMTAARTSTMPKMRTPPGLGTRRALRSPIEDRPTA